MDLNNLDIWKATPKKSFISWKETPALNLWNHPSKVHSLKFPGLYFEKWWVGWKQKKNVISVSSHESEFSILMATGDVEILHGNDESWPSWF